MYTYNAQREARVFKALPSPSRQMVSALMGSNNNNNNNNNNINNDNMYYDYHY